MIELELYHKTVAAIALAEGKPEKKAKRKKGGTKWVLQI